MAAWIPNEDKILIEFYETGTREEILSKLPNRNWKSVYKRSVILGLFRPKDDAWKKEEEELLKKLYSDTPKDLLINHFLGRSWKALSWHAINVLRLTRTKEIVQEETRKTNQSKLGVDYPTQSAEVRKKVKETVQKKFGVNNVFQSEEIKQKITQTNLEKFGVENPNQCPETRQKTTATNLKKYGVENPFQLREKVRKGMLNKYGEIIALRVPEIMEKKNKTNIERYGYETPLLNPEIKKKIEETNLKNLGTETPFQNVTIQNKARQTLLNNYGVENPSQSEKIKEKIIKTCLQKYGVKSFLCFEKIRRIGRELSIKNNSIAWSKGEQDFVKYLKIIDPSIEQHKEHPELKQVIDYYMPKHDLWIQYDGTYWHGKTKRVNQTRQSTKIQQTVERDRIQNKLIPNLIRFWSDDVTNAIKTKTIFKLIENKMKEKIDSFNISMCHQFRKKIECYEKDVKSLPFDHKLIKASSFILAEEQLLPEIEDFIKKYEWLETVGFNVKWCFTARYQGVLAGVILLSEPVSYSKILGQDTPKYEVLIQRGATSSWTPKNLGSRLLMFSCHFMVNHTNKRAFTGYADPEANEKGIIYRACNFDYLGNNFGDNYLYEHPSITQKFSSRYVRRTSTFKRWCKENNIEMQNNWFKNNGFKNLETIPENIKNLWYEWGRKILSESKKTGLNKKSKYVLLLGKTAKEKKFLQSIKTYKALSYPDN
jgi:galactitol-specific phosphotransferase system IIB component